MAITADDFARAMQDMMRQFVTQLQSDAALRTPVGQTGGGVTSPSKLIHKQYSKVEKFGGASNEWKEWHFQFIVATKAAALDVGQVLEALEPIKMDEVTDDIIRRNIDASSFPIMDRAKGELFSVLTLWTKGEANQIVRNVVDSNGFVAWKRLYDRFNPRTPASMAAAWREVIRTKKFRDLRDAAKMVEVWEGKVDLLKREHGESVPDGLKAALLMEMLPDHIQLTVAQGIANQFSYEELKQKVRLMSSVHAEIATPKPMEVDELHEREFSEEPSGAGGWQEVGAVTKGTGRGKGGGPAFGSCWTCGGPHFARECPHNWGGKGGPKGGDKSAGKGDGTGKGKGKGKARAPMFGSCWVCGGAHFQADCPYGPQQAKGASKGKGKGKAMREVDEEDDFEATDVGGITECWSIAEVVETSRGRPGRWRAAKGRPKIELQNKYAALAEVEEVTVEEIEAVTEGGSVDRGEIVIDSGAAESVCPQDWASAFPTKAVAPGQERHFRNASGGRMSHYGEKRVRGTVDGMEGPISMLFQVSDAKNALASVARITERGNLVQFGPDPADNYIFNPSSGDKVMLRRKGNKFILDMDFARRA